MKIWMSQWKMYLAISKRARFVFAGKSDLVSALRAAPIMRKHFCWLVMKAVNPANQQISYFVDKNLPFGASISCSHFQQISNGMRHVVQAMMGRWTIISYLDDFLFLEATRNECNQMVRAFIHLCEMIRFPVSMEKTEWASLNIVF